MNSHSNKKSKAEDDKKLKIKNKTAYTVFFEIIEKKEQNNSKQEKNITKIFSWKNKEQNKSKLVEIINDLNKKTAFIPRNQK
jgi:hypothetical protein